MTVDLAHRAEKLKAVLELLVIVPADRLSRGRGSHQHRISRQQTSLLSLHLISASQAGHLAIILPVWRVKTIREEIFRICQSLDFPPPLNARRSAPKILVLVTHGHGYGNLKVECAGLKIARTDLW